MRLSIVVLLAGASLTSQAVTILSGPSFAKAPNAPLAGVLSLTTDVPSRVGVSVSDGAGTWSRNFYDYGTTHSIPLYGFKPDRINEITVTVYDRFRRKFTAATPVEFITDPLPANFPVMHVLVDKPDQMVPGYTLFRGANEGQPGYGIFVDNKGEVVWYSSHVPSYNDVRQLDNGDLFCPSTTFTDFVEMNLLGQVVKTWPVPDNLRLNFHDGVPTDHGTILYINDDTREVDNFPTSSTDPNAPRQTTDVLYNRIIEMSATDNSLLHNWSLIDMLDPLRIDYLTFTIRSSGADCEHANAVLEDPRDNSIIVSMRHQDAVIKFSRATGQLKWILGPHENWGPAFQKYLLKPVGTPFAWSYGQHAPTLTPQGTLMVYDDGNFRASPFDPGIPDSANYSRAVEYAINEKTMEVSQVWEYGGNIPERLYTGFVGSVRWLNRKGRGQVFAGRSGQIEGRGDWWHKAKASVRANRGNVLVTFGAISYVNGVHPSPYAPGALMVRIKEVTHQQPAHVVFDLALFDHNNTSPSYLGCFTYRSVHVADLYAHPAKPVTDLNVKYGRGSAHLEFSGDPVRTYVIESSTDMVHWTEVGVAEPDQGETGEYDFDDTSSGSASHRYYRVETQ